MLVLSTLEEDEWRIFMHLRQNKNRTINKAKQISNTLIDSDCSTLAKEELARLSEEENYKLKNRYRHNKLTMELADKSKMPVDSRKVRDILKHSNVSQMKLQEEIDNYSETLNNPNFENGVLTYVNEAAYGDLRALLKDIGINRQSIRYTNVAAVTRAREEVPIAPDTYQNFKSFFNQYFTPIDMTEYDYDWPNTNEVGDMSFHSPDKALSLPGQPLIPDTGEMPECAQLEWQAQPKSAPTEVPV